MQIKTTMRYYLPSTRMAIIKKSKNNNCCKDVEKRETVQFGGNVNWYSHMENSVDMPQKTKNRTTIYMIQSFYFWIFIHKK